MASTKCLGCQEEIVGGQFVTIPAGAIHPECFICPCCGKSLLNAKGYLPYKVRPAGARGGAGRSRATDAVWLSAGEARTRSLLAGQLCVQRGLPDAGRARPVAAAADRAALARSADRGRPERVAAGPVSSADLVCRV